MDIVLSSEYITVEGPFTVVKFPMFIDPTKEASKTLELCPIETEPQIDESETMLFDPSLLRPLTDERSILAFLSM